MANMRALCGVHMEIFSVCNPCIPTGSTRPARVMERAPDGLLVNYPPPFLPVCAQWSCLCMLHPRILCVCAYTSFFWKIFGVSGPSACLSSVDLDYRWSDKRRSVSWCFTRAHWLAVSLGTLRLLMMNDEMGQRDACLSFLCLKKAPWSLVG